MGRGMIRMAILGAAALTLAACEGQSPEAQRRTGQVVGGVTGAAVGSMFGSGTGQILAVGAGAVLGTMAGGEIADRRN